MDYTNKVVLFTEKNFGGDALVWMQKLDSGGHKHFNLEEVNLQINRRAGPIRFQKHQSMINEKGAVCLTSHLEFRYTDSARVEDIEFIDNLTAVDFDWDGKINTYFSDKPLLGSLVREDYTLTFYPKLNAYSISPAPLCELIHGKFRWVLHDDDTFTIDWNDEDKIEYAYLEFFSHKESGEPSDRARALPFEVKEYDPKTKKYNWVSPLPQYVIKKGEKIIFTKGADGALWAFNFCCFINGELFRVDPETKRGTGTHN